MIVATRGPASCAKLTKVMSSGSVTWTEATFDGSDGQYRRGDKIPYVPQLIVRQDVAFTPTLGRLFSRALRGRFGAGLTGMFNRPQPYGAFGHDVFLMDLAAELRLQEVSLGVDCFNLLDARWFDSEFTFAGNWNRSGATILVPERYVTTGAARMIMATLSVFIG